MGSPDVRAYSRNKRGIAGSLIWVNFDRHALLSLFHNAGATFLADADEIRPQYQNGEDAGAVFQSSMDRDLGPSIGSAMVPSTLQPMRSAPSVLPLRKLLPGIPIRCCHSM